ncbi:MAG: HNH endonuclease [Clostridiales bacterium]|nr:HNH endonuclease [Clostridiales bacterium]
MFEPGLAIGQILKNNDIVEIFKCGNMGGMRRSKTTNTLVIISDYTKGLYHDKWIGGVLHYTGMGKNGDQDIHWAQNATLASCGRNGVDVHLFEVMDAGEYVYCGRMELVDQPYIDIQPGEDGIDRKVWMFPIRPVPDNDVKKPSMFVFKDMDDYKAHGKNVDAEYMKLLAERKKTGRKVVEKPALPTLAAAPAVPESAVPPQIVGKQLNHKIYGEGTVIGIAGSIIVVSFDSVGEKKLGYEICIKNGLIQFLSVEI